MMSKRIMLVPAYEEEEELAYEHKNKKQEWQKKTAWGTLIFALLMSGAMLSLWKPIDGSETAFIVSDAACRPDSPVAQYRWVGYYKMSPCAPVTK